MFGNLLGKKKESAPVNENAHVALKVSKMNLTEMRTYVNNKLSDFEITNEGLIEVMNRLVFIDEKTSKTYLQMDDMDTKKKKGFDLVLIVAKSKFVSVEIVELLQEFLKVYEELIAKYDKDFKEIYSSRFIDATELAIDSVNKHSEFQRKSKVLGE